MFVKPENLRQNLTYSATLEIFRGAEAFQIPYNKQKSSKIMKMKMFATLAKAKPDTENIRSLNLAAVMCTTVQVSKLSW
jgi:hypothetical protein